MKSNSITVEKYTIRINCLVSATFYTFIYIYMGQPNLYLTA